MNEAASSTRSFPPSLAAVCRAKFVQPGEEVAPNKCTVILYSSGSFVVSPWPHQRKSWCSSLMWTWWNILSTLQANATGSCLKRHKTPTKEFIKAGPCKRLQLREWPWNSAVHSKTICSFLGFLGWYTMWWGMYHAVSHWFRAFSACPSSNIFFDECYIVLLVLWVAGKSMTQLPKRSFGKLSVAW